MIVDVLTLLGAGMCQPNAARLAVRFHALRTLQTSLSNAQPLRTVGV